MKIQVKLIVDIGLNTDDIHNFRQDLEVKPLLRSLLKIDFSFCQKSILRRIWARQFFEVD